MDEASKRRRRRVSLPQLEILWEFLNANKDVATGYNKSTLARDQSRKMWQAVAKALNAQEDGSIKDWKAWSAYWVDFKAKLKKKLAAVSSGTQEEFRPLQDFELKFIGLLNVEGMPSVELKPFPELTTSDTEVNLPSDYDVAEEDPLKGVREKILVKVQEAITAPEPSPSLSRSPSAGLDRPGPIRRRRHREQYMSQYEARKTLTELSKMKLEMDRENNRLLKEISHTLRRLTDAMVARFSTDPRPMM